MSWAGKVNSGTVSRRRSRVGSAWRPSTGAAVVVILAAAGLSACGSSSPSSAGAAGSASSSTAACTTAATKAAATAANPASAVVPYAPVDLSKYKGKSVFFVADSLSVALDVQTAASFKAAATAAGLVPHVLGGDGTPAGDVQVMQEAIAQKPVGIVVHAIDADGIQSELKTAAADHIAVIGDQVPGFAQGYVNQDYSQMGKALADEALAVTSCKTDILLFTISSFANLRLYQAAAQAEVSKLCGSACKVTVAQVDLTSIEQSVSSQTRSAIITDSNLKAIISCCDSFSSFMVSAVQAAGKSSQVKVVTFQGLSALLDDVKNGDVAVADGSGPPPAVEGWIDLDQLGHAIAAQPPVTQYETEGSVLATKENVAQLSPLFGYNGYQSKFLSAWSISS
jgi:ABC-type sugar transport system substrate-binding protein